MKSIKQYIEKFKENRKFKKDMVDWVRLCKCTSEKQFGITKVGTLTHKVKIEGVGEISSNDPIFVKGE